MVSCKLEVICEKENCELSWSTFLLEISTHFAKISVVALQFLQFGTYISWPRGSMIQCGILFQINIMFALVLAQIDQHVENEVYFNMCKL